MKVGILGGGRWGQALARLVKAAGNDPLIAYRDKKPPQILKSTDDPPQVSEACDLLIAAVSARELRSAIRLAKPGANHRIVVAGRGIEPQSGKWLTDVVQEECDAVRVGALAGPAPVQEILNGGLCAGVVASDYAEVRRMVTDGLHSSRYRVYESSDLKGVQVAGAMVPVLATLLGMAMNLRGAGMGMHAMVLCRGLEEATRLSVAIGGEAHTLSGLAGVGDLVAAQTQPKHPNFVAGKALATGKRGEGPVDVARSLAKMASQRGVELPLTEALVSIYDGEHPLDAVSRLMARAPMPEHQ